MIPPQELIVTPETPDVIASFWEYMTGQAPDLFNAWFAMVPGMHVADD